MTRSMRKRKDSNATQATARDAGNIIGVGLAFAANHLGKDVAVCF